MTSLNRSTESPTQSGSCREPGTFSTPAKDSPFQASREVTNSPQTREAEKVEIPTGEDFQKWKFWRIPKAKHPERNPTPDTLETDRDWRISRRRVLRRRKYGDVWGIWLDRGEPTSSDSERCECKSFLFSTRCPSAHPRCEFSLGLSQPSGDFHCF